MINISDYGYFDSNDKYKLNSIARVTSVYKDKYELLSPHGVIYANLKASVYFYNGDYDFPTTGDFVIFDYNEVGDSTILETLPRRTYFSRKDPDKGKGEQPIAANFDYVFIVQSLNHDFNKARLERYLAIAWESGAIPIIILTKSDLVENIDSFLEKIEDVAFGVDIIPISSFQNKGFELLDKYLQTGKTIVLLGSSGVGKSSLVNKLFGSDIMSVNEIREDDSKGRHTTTNRQLIILDNKSMIIDTPGMRELGIWSVDTGLSESFADVESLFRLCRFSDCKHESEPECGVQLALESGQLDPDRWNSYLKLKREAKFMENRLKATENKKEWAKSISKQQKNLKKHKNKY